MLDLYVLPKSMPIPIWCGTESLTIHFSTAIACSILLRAEQRGGEINERSSVLEFALNACPLMYHILPKSGLDTTGRGVYGLVVCLLAYAVATITELYGKFLH
uniref:Uncharacterized protein n=1 Tax=Solanum lycopersicum TaxID=4081 RepID=A0A3Q7HLG5_SOLLC